MDQADHANHFQKLMTSAMQSGQFSDLVLTCKGRKFHVHKVIVCRQSRFFDTACHGEFKESLSSEVDLNDDLESLERMITYMYTFTYDENSRVQGSEERKTDKASSKDPRSDNQTTQENLTLEDRAISSSSVRTYAIAEKYGVQLLKSLAQQKFGAWLEVNWSTSHCPAVIAEAFQTTPADDEGLRSVAASILAKHVPDIMHSQAWQAVLAEHGQLTLQILTQSTLCRLGMEHSLNMDIRQLKSEVQVLSEARVHEAQGRSTVRQSLQLLRDLLQKNDKCRHCSAPFNAYLEAKEPPILRCNVCQTKHR